MFLLLRNFFRTNYRSLLRLTVVLCLFWLCMSQVKITKISSQHEDDGIGGGSQLDVYVSDSINNIDKTELADDEIECIEAGISEPEYFSKQKILMYHTYTIKPGDMSGKLASDFGLNLGTLISVNNIKDTRSLQIGQNIRVPNQDGILYRVNSSDTLDRIAAKHKVDIKEIKIANELFSDTVKSGSSLFIPGAKMNWVELSEINGDLFIWPVRGRISSGYGYRSHPFTGARQFHSGIDISASHGTPVRAAMPGRVSAAGFDNIFGNYVVISHHSGYRTLYAHLSVIRVKSGTYVGMGERIGDVGNTGQSTGSHLHFTVYKDGKTVNPLNLMR